MDSVMDTSLSSQSCSSSVVSTPFPVKGNSLSPQGAAGRLETFDDLLAGSMMGQDKYQLHDALVQLIKRNPHILEAMQKESQTTNTATLAVDSSNLNNQFPHGNIDRQSARSTIEGSSNPKERIHPEQYNSLNQPCVRGANSSTDSDEDAWHNATCPAAKNMTPRELRKWRRTLFSVFVGHLPRDIRRIELIQLFSEVGNIQDAHLQPPEESRMYTYGFVRYSTLEEVRRAVSELNGKVLGNKCIAVEIASETRHRLACGSDDEDGPLSSRDKLLRRDFSRISSYRPMSAVDSAEKLLEWKLRQFTAEPKTSHAAFVKDYMTINSTNDVQDEFMEKIKEIVKKIADVPFETQASASGEEGPAFPQGIVRDSKSVLRDGNPVSQEQRPALLSPNQLPSSVLRDGNFVSQQQRPALVSPDRLPSSVLRDGNSVSQELRPALVSPNQLPSSVLRDGNLVPQKQRPALVSPDRLPSSVLCDGNPVSQEQRPALVSPNQLPSSVLRDGNLVPQEQRPALVSPDRLPSSVLRDGNPVSQEQRPALASPNQLPSSVLRDGNLVPQEQRPASVSPNQLPSSVLRDGNPVSQEQRPALVSPDRLPSSVLRDGNSVSQEQRPASASPDRLPSSVLRDGNSVSQQQRPASASPDRLPSSVLCDGNPVPQQRKPALVSPDRLPSSVLCDGNPVSQQQRPALVSPDRLPSSVLCDGNPVPQDQRPALVSQDRLSNIHAGTNRATKGGIFFSDVSDHEQSRSLQQRSYPESVLPPSSAVHAQVHATHPTSLQHGEMARVSEERRSLLGYTGRAESGIQRNAVCTAEVGRLTHSANVHPYQSSAAAEPQGLCNRETASPRRPHSTTQGTGEPVVQPPPQEIAHSSCSAPATPYRSGVLPFVDQFQAPFHNPSLSYPPHQRLADVQNQMCLSGFGRGRPFPQKFHTPPPRPHFDVPRFGNLGASQTWPRDVARFQPSRFGHFHSPYSASTTGPLLRPTLEAAVGRRFPVNPQKCDVAGHVLMNEFGSPVVTSDRTSSPQLYADMALSKENYPETQTRTNIMVCGEQKTVQRGVMSKTALSHSMNSLDDFDSPGVCEGITSSTQAKMVGKETKQSDRAEAQGSVAASNAEQNGLMKDVKEVVYQGEHSRNEPGSSLTAPGKSSGRNENSRPPHHTTFCTKRNEVHGVTAVNGFETDMGYKGISSNDEGSNSNGKSRAKSAESGQNQCIESIRPPLRKQDSGIQSPDGDTAVYGLGKKEASLLQLKMELENISEENKKLRMELGDQKKLSRKIRGMYSHEQINALEEEIRAKEIQLQREKELISARFSEQELLYEREKLEVAFDIAMTKELETERAIGETRNALTMAKFEQELLSLYRKLMSLS